MRELSIALMRASLRTRKVVNYAEDQATKHLWEGFVFKGGKENTGPQRDRKAKNSDDDFISDSDDGPKKQKRQKWVT